LRETQPFCFGTLKQIADFKTDLKIIQEDKAAEEMMVGLHCIFS
jgi:hypothetical protein